jgi:hypothetical protein
MRANDLEGIESGRYCRLYPWRELPGVNLDVASDDQGGRGPWDLTICSLAPYSTCHAKQTSGRWQGPRPEQLQGRVIEGRERYLVARPSETRGVESDSRDGEFHDTTMRSLGARKRPTSFLGPMPSPGGADGLERIHVHVMRPQAAGRPGKRGPPTSRARRRPPVSSPCGYRNVLVSCMAVLPIQVHLV